MEKEWKKYHDLVAQQQQQQQTVNSGGGGADTAALEEIAATYNELREQALKSRWELMVHRQAAGFIVNNHEDVAQHHPIKAKLTVDNGGDGTSSAVEGKAAKKPKFGDQLDWWRKRLEGR
jgi:hypothetical protein